MPTTTTGKASEFITFSRTSNATVTDSDGKIKWAPHNLLLASEQFDASNWTKYLAPITANAQVAPNGTTTADTVTTSDNYSSVNQTLAVLTGAIYTFAFYAKRGTMTDAKLSVRDVNNAADIVAATSYYSATNSSTWSLVTQTFTVPAGCTTITVHALKESFATGTIHLWGAHLYRSDLGAMMANASAYPTYNPTTAKNLLGFTESLTTGWTNTNTTDAIALEVNPVSLTGAVDVAATAGNGTLLGSVSLLASPYTFSIWLKRKTGAGTVEITVDGTTYVTAAVTGTWTRFSTTLTPSAGTKTPGIRLVTSGDAVYAWGAQLSDSASLDAYVPNYGAAPTAAAYYGPRLDFDGATLAAKGLLVEELRANLITYSSDLSNAPWGSAGVNISGTPAWINVSNGPDGAMSADKIIESNTTAQHYFGRSVTVTSGATYSLSMYLKAEERTWAWIEFYGGIPGGTFYINLSTGDKGTTTGSASAVTVTAVGGNWWRVVLPGFVASSTTPTFAVYTSTGNGVNSYAGDGTSGIYLWGAQLEEGAFATSYIPVGSTTAGATRNADVASVSTQAFPYSSTEGTWVANFQTLFTGTASSTAWIVGADNSNSKRIMYMPATDDRVRSFDGSTEIIATGDATGAITKSAAAFGPTDRALVTNGGTVATGAVASGYGTASVTTLGSSNSLSALNGHIRQITYLPRRVTNAELQTRTT